MSFISSFMKGYGKVSQRIDDLDSIPRFPTLPSPSLKASKIPSAGPSEDENDMTGEGNYWFNQAAEKDPFLPSLSKKQRIIGFFFFICLGLFCFALAGLVAPFILLRARKFVMLYSMGSVFTIGSFSLLWGPMNHIKHLFSYARLPFTVAYFGTLFGTLYSALILRSTLITLGFATVQIVSLVWYIFSYVPGGTTGLKFFTKLFTSAFTKTIGSTLPV